MMYLVGKLIIYLLAALGIGFGLGWALQLQMARRLREQLNSVIFETKSRIPRLESEVTNRDQKIEQLQRQVKTIQDNAAAAAHSRAQGPNAEQEKRIAELQQRIMDLEQELRVANREQKHEGESLVMLDDAGLEEDTEPEELAADDEFLSDIQDIFDDTSDDDFEVFGGTNATDSEKKKINDLKSGGDRRVRDLESQVEELASSRKNLSDQVSTQKRELSQLQQQRDLQEKSLSVLNQQLELARLANERILRELAQAKGDKPQSAAS